MKYSRNRLTKIKNKKDTKKIKILKRFKAKGGINKTNKKRKQSHLKHKTLKYIGGDKANDTKMTPVKNIETNVPITKDTKPVSAPKPIVKDTTVQDLALDIKKRYFNECTYFEKLKQEDSFVYTSIQEKVRFFKIKVKY